MTLFSNIRTWAALLIAGAAFAACSGDDDSLTPTPSPNGEGNGQQVYTMTVQASKGGEGTRALTLTGSTLSATWAQGEEVTVYNVTTDEELTDKLTAQGSGSSTTLKGSLSSTKGIHNGDQLMLKFCSDTYSGQDGTLEYIAANCDYAEATVTVSTISNGNITISESHADFQNQQAIVKFSLKQSDGSALPSNPTALTVDYGTGAVSLTSIPADTYSNENNGNGVLYVAIPGLDSKYLTLKATVGSSTYIYSKPDVTFANSQYYTIGVKMKVCNVTGRVIDNSGNPLAGVVVSDGAQCVKTLSDGTFYMASDIAIDHTKFVYISTPSGYLPAISGGIPHFYKLTEDFTPLSDVYDFGDYMLTPVVNPDRFTVLMTADLQPRKNTYTLDRIAYMSLNVCQDLYQELYDVASGISGRQVYGICLGDIVHEDMGLYNQYTSALRTLGYPTYNVIGNRDCNPVEDSDDNAAATFESNFGPRNYSFNIGGIHFVVLDNLKMKDNGYGKLTAYDEGLSDAVWTWLQADLALVPTTTKLMVCSHAPMFKLEGGGDASSTAAHGSDYAALLDRYDEVHVWAGHTHSSFNYIYPGGSHKNIQVHTQARSTGELYTNEYLSNGTPRGFTVLEVNNGNITWKFHPMTRQRGAFQGDNTGYCSAGAPAYTWRDWDYSGGVAVMNGGGSLTESYQMHAYPRGSYGDNYVYVNIFLWDENWGTPVWTPDGGDPVALTRINTADNHNIVDASYVYDKADKEIRNWYKTYANKSGGSLATKDDYTIVPTDKITTLFRTTTTVSATPASGTVSVTDRFGNVYSRSVSW